MDGVKSDIALPSIADALDIGEAFLDHCLVHDRIRRAPDFKVENEQALFIPRLKELSQERINTCQDFGYVIQDVLKAKKRMDANKLTVNKAAREKELAESDEQQKTRNAERRERFAKMSEQDKLNLTFYKITLDDLDGGVALKPYDPVKDAQSYMRRAKDETADLDQTPEWPSGLDPVKRESLSVITDLVKLTENARMAGILK
jgi:carboxyl-terminal processing protease